MHRLDGAKETQYFPDENEKSGIWGREREREVAEFLAHLIRPARPEMGSGPGLHTPTPSNANAPTNNDGNNS